MAASGSESLLPDALFTSRNYALMVAAAASLSFGIFASQLVMTIYFELAARLSLFHAGLAQVPMWLAATLVSPVGGRVSDRVGRRPVLVGAFAVFAGGDLVAAVLATAGLPWEAFVGALVVAGLGAGFVHAPAGVPIMDAPSYCGCAMSRRWRRWAPRLMPAATPAWRTAAAYGALVTVLAGGLSQSVRIIPGPPPTEGGPVPATTHAAAAFQQIVMPDLVVVAPKGISSAALARVRKIHGLRAVLAVDGASLTVNGQRFNAIGVDAQQYRSWTPLRTASREVLWSSLDRGGFAASLTARRALRLRHGNNYTLTGSSSVSLPFGGAAPLGIAGIDLVVSNRYSARLGLIHNVAALVSAPGVAMGTLQREVRAALGPGGSLTPLRQQQQSLPVDSARSGARPSNYLDLFRESAAQYCPSMSWTVLAAIGQIESGDGTNMGPSTAGALGPMQFLPSTWKIWGIAAFGEPEPPNIMDPYDAVPSAARYLCAAGAGSPGGLARAIYAYNHANWYVSEVLALAQQYAKAYG